MAKRKLKKTDPALNFSFLIMKKLLVLLAWMALFSACHKTPDGKWEDIIKLSVKNVQFGSDADSVIVTAQGDWWWIDGITFNDSTFCTQADENYKPETEHYTFARNGYVVEKRDKHTLFVKLDKNSTGKERTLSVSLEAGDYFDGVTVKQAAK